MPGRWGTKGAGILVTARSTGRVLLLRRSVEVNEGGTWGTPGGKTESRESARVSAIRELREEAGYSGPVTVLKDPIFVFSEPDFEFQTFFGHVTEEFEPYLNWESEDAGWFALSKLPKPLHFGVIALMRERKSDIAEEIARIRWQP
jgi:8-oxo-dGTP pyrophosphatase MutT (NUDIX family)